MKGSNYVVGQNGEHIAIQIDLKDHDEQLSEYVEYLLDLLKTKTRKEEKRVPWKDAVLSMKMIPSFADIIERQGSRKLTFEELYPCIDESDSEYSEEDLLAAFNSFGVSKCSL